MTDTLAASAGSSGECTGSTSAVPEVRSHGARWSFWVLAGVLGPPLLLVLVDLALRGSEIGRWLPSRWLAYALSVALDVTLFWLGFALTRHLWRRSRRAGLMLAGLGATLVSTWVVSAFVYHRLFHSYPTWSDLVFVTEEGGHVAETWGLFAPFLDVPVCGAILIGAVGLFGSWRVALSSAARPVRSRATLLLVGLALVLSVNRALIPDTVGASPSSSLSVSAAQLFFYYSSRTRGAVHGAAHAAVPKLPSAPNSPNVLFLLNESLSRSRLDLYGYSEPTTPKLREWLSERQERTVLFSRATANASNTSISVITLLTGLSPDATTEQVHTQPFAWQYAQAAGYWTFLWSSQSFRYANFAEYFLTTPPDHAWTAEKSGQPLLNGGGMDDELAIAAARDAVLRARRTGRPFFGVMQFNNTHFPFHSRSDRPRPFDNGDRLGRYLNAIVQLDTVIVDFLRWLDEQGLDDTLIVFSSDHGEPFDGHEPHRTQSYYEDVTGIPMLVHVPGSMMSARPDAVAQLRQNRDRRVQNLDVLPTLLDGMGILEAPAIREYVAQFGGQSLFTPIAADRSVVIMNNNAIRTWVNEGFGIVNGDQKYMFSERHGEALFDLGADPHEQQNQWDPHHRPRWYDATLAQHPDLCALRQRHCEPAAGCTLIPCSTR